MNVKEALTGAYRLVEGNWHQGEGTDGAGNYCLRVAIGIATGAMTDNQGKVTYTKRAGDSHDEYAAHWRNLRTDHYAITLVTGCLPEGFDSIPVYNDNPDTTRRDVLAVIDKAISLC